MHWIHVLHVLTTGYQHIHGTRVLFHFYMDHDAVTLLKSGVTSGSGDRSYLWWLAVHHIAPVDW